MEERIYTVRFLKGWSDGTRTFNKGDRVTMPAAEADPCIKDGAAIVTGNLTRAANLKKAVVPELEQR